MTGATITAATAAKGSVTSLLTSKPPTDFSGEWLCTDIEGDMGKLLEALGVGWMSRKAAGAAGYGKGKATTTIEHNGKAEITVTNVSRMGTKTSTLKTDGSEQEIESPDGAVATGTLKWEGAALVSTIVQGEKTIAMKRYMRGDLMCLDLTVGDVSVTRVFTKQ